ncbi:DUF3263 domain-containing protein [Polymorphospora lycopeni]|uniref:DUF3263 domain-containing protein n=1 Tax=Polymorphospora lycopeni TaxID=3140240 RepID=A0ABV5CTC9_9ACTN
MKSSASGGRKSSASDAPDLRPPDGAAEPAGVPGPDGPAGAGDATGAGAPPDGAARPEVPPLTDRELQVLAFEQKWWKHAGSKEQAIRDAFDLSATRYYQILNGLLDNPAALAAAPVLVARLRRLRSTRARTRRR